MTAVMTMYAWKDQQGTIRAGGIDPYAIPVEQGGLEGTAQKVKTIASAPNNVRITTVFQVLKTAMEVLATPESDAAYVEFTLTQEEE